MPDAQPGPWVRGAVWALGLSLGVTVGLVGTLYSDVRSDSLERHERVEKQLEDLSHKKQLLRKQINTLVREHAALAEHVYNHDSTAAEWKVRIMDMEATVRGLATEPTTRPDPFTGTEGVQLERRIDKLELEQVAFKLFKQMVEEDRRK